MKIRLLKRRFFASLSAERRQAHLWEVWGHQNVNKGTGAERKLRDSWKRREENSVEKFDWLKYKALRGDTDKAWRRKRRTVVPQEYQRVLTDKKLKYEV